MFDEMFEWVFHWLFLIFYCVDLKQWSIFRRSCTIQRRRTSEVEGSVPWCNVKRSQDQLNEFNQEVNPGDTRRVEYVRYKHPTLDEGRISFTWVELKNDENMKSMFWEHMFQWVDMRVTLLRSAEDIIKSLIPPEDRD